MLDAGIDPMQRMIDRCRQRRINPWVSIRMNDVHDAHLLRSPLHSRMWMEHHEYWRYPDRFSAWNDRCFNYGLKPVRDHMMALIREVCDRFDMDGLESELWQLFNEMHSVDALAQKDRSYVVTFVDINIPGKPIPPALPKRLAHNESAEFKLFIGPKPLAAAKSEVQLTLKPEKAQEKCVARVALNGHAGTGGRPVFQADAFCEGYNTIRVTNAGTSPLSVQSVELAVRFPRK